MIRYLGTARDGPRVLFDRDHVTDLSAILDDNDAADDDDDTHVDPSCI